MQENLRQALEIFIARQAGAERVEISESKLLTGGAVQENWLVKGQIVGGKHAGALDAVIRTDSPSCGVAVSHNRAEEFALLKAAFAAGVTVPEPLWLCVDKAVIGRPFFVMRRVDGTAAGHLLVKDERHGGNRVQLLEQLGMELARIHSIRPPRADLDFLEWYEEAPALHAVNRFRRYLDSHSIPHPTLEWGLRWLERHAPPRGEVALCHRDFRTGNYMVDDKGVTGILDWEFAGWGDPLEDIGWFCAKCWRFGAKAKNREAGGVGDREDFYRGYEKISGRPLDRDLVRYWEVMAHAAWAIIAIQQAERHVSGEEKSLMLALTGHIVPELEYEILTMTEGA
ncbi:MAG: phosphotransferase family protein [Desulfobulbus sp.]|nr:phosphotransferase family protein [Desulfobulbus sp.]